MKTIAVAVAISLIAASPSLASPKRSPSVAPKVRDARAMVVEAAPFDVHVAGRLVGRDPDPAIRAHLKDDYYRQFGN